MNLKSNQKGFTIVELLIVIVVIAILAAISIVAFTGIQQRGRDSQRASDVSNIVKALTAYTSDGHDWPDSAAAAGGGPSGTGGLRSYNTANLSDDILDKLTGTAASSSGNTTYGYAVCPTGATGSSITGVEISYVKEQDNNTVEVAAGVC